MAENGKAVADIIASLEKFFKQLPSLPASVKEVLVKIAPWLALIFGVLGIIAGLGVLGLSPLALFGGLHASFLFIIAGVASIVASVLMLIAYPKLVKKQYKGWELLFWSSAVSAVSAVLSLTFGTLIGIFIGFYLLFQVKSYYK